MAARKPARRAPTRRKKQRSWRIPKVLLFLSYSAVLVALGSLFFMKTELQRFKGASEERAVADPVPEKNTPAPVNKPKSETRTAETLSAGEITADEKQPKSETRTAAPRAGEITSDEKKQLESILRSRSGQ